MIDSINKNNASCIRELMIKSFKHRKVKFSHLNTCMKNITCSRAEIGRKEFTNMMNNIDFIEYILRKQKSSVPEKKQAIIDEIVKRVIPERERYITSELVRDTLVANNKKDNNQSGPDQRFPDASYTSVIHNYNDGVNKPDGHAIKQKFIGELKYKLKHQSPGNVNNIERSINERKSVLLKENSRPLTEMEKKLAERRKKIAELAPPERAIANKKPSQSESVKPLADKYINANGREKWNFKNITDKILGNVPVSRAHLLKKRHDKMTQEINAISRELINLNKSSSDVVKNGIIKSLCDNINYTRTTLENIHSTSSRLSDPNLKDEAIQIIDNFIAESNLYRSKELNAYSDLRRIRKKITDVLMDARKSVTHFS
ncbi:hypothetical protein [Erwinia mallotivora]|uniref:hypothetical protein n=1 Tax=Erwinia mallotivora TaxID=69222 RepID=UPI0021BE5BE3|nr:hypothetical protein [Erwinia mallotivora]